MPKRKGRLAIVGLGTVGQSLGLALRATSPELEVVGHDRDPEASREAHRRGAIQHSHWNLISAVEGAPLVILALPTPEVLATLQVLKDNLPSGTVLTDTAPLKGPLARWEAAEMPSGIHYVGGHPLVRPRAPDAAAFARSTYCLTPGEDAAPEAVNAVVGLVESIGARPAFLDPDEHDGLMWALQGAPALAAALAIGKLCEGRTQADLGWLAEAVPEEVIRLARLGESFLGGIVFEEDTEPGLRCLTELGAALAELVRDLEKGPEAAAAAAARLTEQREAWLTQRKPDDEEPGRSRGTMGWRRILGSR